MPNKEFIAIFVITVSYSELRIATVLKLHSHVFKCGIRISSYYAL
jgi:hypothetical protein